MKSYSWRKHEGWCYYTDSGKFLVGVSCYHFSDNTHYASSGVVTFSHGWGQHQSDNDGSEPIARAKNWVVRLCDDKRVQYNYGDYE